jgi:hypothetical protein
MLAVRVARVFDGRDLVPGAGVVLVDGGRIAGVEPAGFQPPVARPSAARRARCRRRNCSNGCGRRA